MKEPLVLSLEDLGTTAFSITYKAAKNAKPVFSGGKRINGFSKNSNGIWEAKIFENSGNNLLFDQLYVNTKRAVLAKTPNVGFFKIDTVKQKNWINGDTRVPEKATQYLFFEDSALNALESITDDEIDQIRFQAFHKWDVTLRY